jgi:uncharacterized glyoxalase superfamily protein PhnB
VTQSTLPRLCRAAPEIPVEDLDAALAYYSDHLGFRTRSRMPDGDYAIIQRDDVALHLFKGSAATQPASCHIFASGLDALSAELSERGARIIQPVELKPWGTRDFRVADPYGNEIKFTEPVN